jgi:ribosome biogenesis GTPase
MHTTTGAYLIPGTKLIDTPGIREFGLINVKPAELRRYFPEFQGLACAEPDCWHRHEAGCAAHGLARYGSYRRMIESLIAGEN